MFIIYNIKMKILDIIKNTFKKSITDIKDFHSPNNINNYYNNNKIDLLYNFKEIKDKDSMEIIFSKLEKYHVILLNNYNFLNNKNLNPQDINNAILFFNNVENLKKEIINFQTNNKNIINLTSINRKNKKIINIKSLINKNLSILEEIIKFKNDFLNNYKKDININKENLELSNNNKFHIFNIISQIEPKIKNYSNNGLFFSLKEMYSKYFYLKTQNINNFNDCQDIFEYIIPKYLIEINNLPHISQKELEDFNNIINSGNIKVKQIYDNINEEKQIKLNIIKKQIKF